MDPDFFGDNDEGNDGTLLGVLLIAALMFLLGVLTGWSIWG